MLTPWFLRAALACCALSVPGAGAPGYCQSPENLEVAQRFVVSSGLAVQLQAVPGQIRREVEQLRGKVPDEMVHALGEASLKGFQPAASRTAARRSACATTTRSCARSPRRWRAPGRASGSWWTGS